MGGNLNNLNQQYISNNPLECGTAFGMPRIHQGTKRNRYYLLPLAEPILDNGAMCFGHRATLPSRNEATASAAAEGQIILFDSIENEFIKKAVEIVNSQIVFQSDGDFEPELLKLAKAQFFSQATALLAHC